MADGSGLSLAFTRSPVDLWIPPFVAISRCISRTFTHTKGCFVRRLRIGILDLVAKGPSKALWGKLMNANLASIMPQIIAVWCEEEGHEVHFVCYTGAEDLLQELPKDLDMVFISAVREPSLACQTPGVVAGILAVPPPAPVGVS